MLEGLMQNPYAWLILAISTVGSLILGIYTWITGKEKRRLTYISSTFTLVNERHEIIPDLCLLFRGKLVTDLTITRYAIWNSGNVVLNGDDVASRKPLRIISVSQESKIIDAAIIMQNEETNMFQIIKRSDKLLELQFDYLNKNDGVVLQVIHTGSSSGLNLECKLKGGQFERLFSQSLLKATTLRRKQSSAYVVIAILLTISVNINNLSLIYQYFSKNSTFIDISIPEATTIALCLLLSIFSFYMLRKTIKKELYLDLPTTLRDGVKWE